MLTKSNLEKKRLFQIISYISSLREVRVRTQDRNLEIGPEAKTNREMLFIGLFFKAYSAIFLMQPRAIFPGWHFEQLGRPFSIN